MAEAHFSAVLPLDFTAFFMQHHRAYLRYACLQLDEEREAETVVEDVFAELAADWSEVLRQPNVPAYAMAALKEAIAQRMPKHKRQPFVASAAFAAARKASRAQLNILESQLGLYAAIARLPERQYDVIVLRFVLGYNPKQVAHIMGVTYATVRSHISGARRRLARELRIAWEEPQEEEQA
ncbi:sigma-70 family RNA polymerase sigma factor [Streptomyces sp. NPDC047117]|uniref:RNA polymerase sigma factor n=1 Tax=Streptomyces sp. NPDC047117 TaxID=3155379 RepID=UPI0033ECC181